MDSVSQANRLTDSEQITPTKPTNKLVGVLDYTLFGWWGALTLAVGVALAIRVWAILQWPINFESDEAILGLMARHVLQGQMPIYMYGQHYLGTLETLVSAGAMWLFGKGILSFRLSALPFIGTFFVLHAVLVRKLWGMRVALISVVLLAFPGYLILTWTYRPISGFGAMFVIGTTILLLAQFHGERWWLRYGQAMLIGILIGLGLWSHPMTIIYIVTAALLYWMRMAEWTTLYERFVRRAAPQALPVVTLSLVGLGIAAFFAGGCAPPTVFSILQVAARSILVLIATSLALCLLLVSQRRTRLLAGALVLLSGFVLGNFPQWGGWFFFHTAPDAALHASCPGDALPRLRLLTDELLPAVWGLPAFHSILHVNSLSSIAWLVAVFVVVIVLAVWFWMGRKTLIHIFALAPLARQDQPVALITFLWALPVILAALGSNTIDQQSVRYLIITWQASSVLLAVLISFLVTKAKWVGIMLLILWIAFVGGTNLRLAYTFWSVRKVTYGIESVAPLQAFLRQNNIRGGYADYSLAYTLDFVVEEHEIFVPYNGGDRYPAYSAKVHRLPVQAYVFLGGTLPPTISRAEQLSGVLQQHNGPLDVFPDVLQQLDTKVVVDHRHIAEWDIWIVK